MISVRFLLRDKQAKRKSTIRVSVSYSGQRIVFCPGYSIRPAHWDSKIGFPKSIKGSTETKSIITDLKELEVKIRRLFDDLSTHGRENVPSEIFTQKILNIVRPQKHAAEQINRITFLDFFDLFIKDCESGRRLKDNQYQIEENSIKPYRTTKLHFSNFEKESGRKIYVTDINQDLHDEFSNYLLDILNLSKNAHSKYIMGLSQVVKYAVKKKVIPFCMLNEIDFNTRREETDNIYLDENEIQLLMNLTSFSSKLEENVRDIFVFGCYTGLRFSNYSNINLDYINNGILITIQKKTKQKVTIPIHPNVKMIIEKHQGILPKCPTNQEFNRTLKDLGKRIPQLNVPFSKQITRGKSVNIEETMKWQKLMTHTARRSFCTNMYLLGVPVITIMSISGHKTQKSFMSYIKATGEEHAQIMKKIWDGNLKKERKTSRKR